VKVYQSFSIDWVLSSSISGPKPFRIISRVHFELAFQSLAARPGPPAMMSD
jgi:hypothetical protein